MQLKCAVRSCDQGDTRQVTLVTAVTYGGIFLCPFLGVDSVPPLTSGGDSVGSTGTSVAPFSGWEVKGAAPLPSQL